MAWGGGWVQVGIFSPIMVTLDEKNGVFERQNCSLMQRERVCLAEKNRARPFVRGGRGFFFCLVFSAARGDAVALGLTRKVLMFSAPQCNAVAQG